MKECAYQRLSSILLSSLLPIFLPASLLCTFLSGFHSLIQNLENVKLVHLNGTYVSVQYICIYIYIHFCITVNEYSEALLKKL